VNSHHQPRHRSSRGNATNAERGKVSHHAKPSLSPMCVGFEGTERINWHAIDAACDRFLKSRGLDKREFSGTWGWRG
jgi:hypothetical protein